MSVSLRVFFKLSSMLDKMVCSDTFFLTKQMLSDGKSLVSDTAVDTVDPIFF